MKLTPFAKLFVTLIILGVVGYVLYAKRENLTNWANQGSGSGGTTAGKDDKTVGPAGNNSSGLSKDDFSAIGAAREAGRRPVPARHFHATALLSPRIHLH